MTPDFYDNGIRWMELLPTGDTFIIAYRDVRRERTGVHAVVAVGLEWGETGRTTILDMTALNIGRSEDRIRLANSAVRAIPEGSNIVKGILTAEKIKRELMTTAAETPNLWEIDRIEVVTYQGDEEAEDIEFVVRPWIIRGGGTILYAPPGSGKSYLLQSLALAVGAGDSRLWEVQVAHPVLYVNLERDRTSMLRRELALKRAMGLKGPSNVHYIHASGVPLRSLDRRIHDWLTRNRGPIFLDSISRAGQGSLVEDETANSLVDMLNAYRDGAAWCAIGHTPHNGDHVFGSMHFTAGADLVVRVRSERRDATIGAMLEITKANDIGNFPPVTIALDFDEPDKPLVAIRRAGALEFPELATTKNMSNEQRMAAFIETQADANATPSEVAKALGMDVGNVSRMLSHGTRFVFTKQVGRSRYYGVRQDSE